MKVNTPYGTEREAPLLAPPLENFMIQRVCQRYKLIGMIVIYKKYVDLYFPSTPIVLRVLKK